MKELERHFRPEFIGRLDDVIVFRPLSRDEPRNDRRVRAEARSPSGWSIMACRSRSPRKPRIS